MVFKLVEKLNGQSEELNDELTKKYEEGQTIRYLHWSITLKPLSELHVNRLIQSVLLDKDAVHG